MNFNELKLSLVDYLIRVERYKPSKLSDEKTSYLVNKRQSKKIVVVTIGVPMENDRKLQEIKTNISNGKRERIETLTIAVTSDNLKGAVCVEDLEEAKIKLKDYFSKIVKLTTALPDEKQYTDEEILDQLQNPSNSTNQKLKDLISSMNNRSAVSIIFSVFFIIMPLVTYVLWIYLSRADEDLLNSFVASLFFGGSTKALTIDAGQYWRILTYGFNNINYGIFIAPVQIIFAILVVIKTARYTEKIIGSWKFAFIIFATYILTGLFVTILMPTVQIAGIMVFVISVISVLGVTTWNKKRNAISIYSNSRFLLPLIAVLVYMIFLPHGDVVSILAALALSSAITLFFTYDYKHIDLFLGIPIIIVAGFLFVPLIGLIMESNGLVYNEIVARSLLVGVRKWVFNVDKVNTILNENLGWRYFIANSSGDFVIQPFM
ncbi:hypothetical protein [Spiroplasma clarkii]|nr:hypothetical protein [Spiroplasma clarkii]